MPSLENHHSAKHTKLLYFGNSGTGKTGSLESLVAAGYKVKVLDMDNGLDSLAAFVREKCPDKIGNIEYITIRDQYTSGPSGPYVKRPKAFVEALKALEKWPEDDSNPAEWGEDTVFVLDSLTAFAKASFEWARGMNPTSKDPRQWYAASQNAVEDTIAMLTAEEFKTNLIVMSHVAFLEANDGTVKGYASAVGSALGPKLPKYFNNCLMTEVKGSGGNVRRIIRSVPTVVVDLKTSAPFKVPTELPLESGLAELFSKLKGK